MSYFTGPYLRIYAPDCSLEQRKIMAAELTEAIADVLQLTGHRQEAIQVHFCPYHLDAVSVGGRLLSETEEPHYHLEFFGCALCQEKKAALGRRLMPLLQELLNIPYAEVSRISLIFHEVPPGDLLMGSRTLAEVLRGRPELETCHNPNVAQI